MPLVKSSMIKFVEWTTNGLLVQFNNNEWYMYQDVPHITFRELMQAESIGKFFDSNIKKRNYNFTKITPEQASTFIASQKVSDVMHSDPVEDFEKNVTFFVERGMARREMDENGHPRVVILGEWPEEILKLYGKRLFKDPVNVSVSGRVITTRPVVQNVKPEIKTNAIGGETTPRRGVK